jgi:hypothetical protein
VNLLPWVVTLMVGVALSILGQLAGAIWFASRVNSELREAKADISSLGGKVEDLRKEVTSALGNLSQRIAHLEGKLNGHRQ